MHVKNLLDRFVKKTMSFIKLNEQEIGLMKNKVTRDLATQEKSIDQKIRALKQTVEADAEKSE